MRPKHWPSPSPTVSTNRSSRRCPTRRSTPGAGGLSTNRPTPPSPLSPTSTSCSTKASALGPRPCRGASWPSRVWIGLIKLRNSSRAAQSIRVMQAITRSSATPSPRLRLAQDHARSRPACGPRSGCRIAAGAILARSRGSVMTGQDPRPQCPTRHLARVGTRQAIAEMRGRNRGRNDGRSR